MKLKRKDKENISIVIALLAPIIISAIISIVANDIGWLLLIIPLFIVFSGIASWYDDYAGFERTIYDHYEMFTVNNHNYPLLTFDQLKVLLDQNVVKVEYDRGGIIRLGILSPEEIEKFNKDPRATYNYHGTPIMLNESDFIKTTEYLKTHLVGSSKIELKKKQEAILRTIDFLAERGNDNNSCNKNKAEAKRLEG